LRRKRLVVRRFTSSGRDLPDNARESLEVFLRECMPFMEMGFDLDSLLNADETSIKIDPPTRRTYDVIGQRRVEAVTSGQQKTRVSVCLTAFILFSIYNLPIKFLINIQQYSKNKIIFAVILLLFLIFLNLFFYFSLYPHLVYKIKKLKNHV
jgi:hypothetical protein